jgi:hypothetical protein
MADLAQGKLSFAAPAATRRGLRDFERLYFVKQLGDREQNGLGVLEIVLDVLCLRIGTFAQRIDRAREAFNYGRELAVDTLFGCL